MYIIIGVTCFVMGDTINSLLSRCDKALYQAKHHGGIFTGSYKTGDKNRGVITLTPLFPCLHIDL